MKGIYTYLYVILFALPVMVHGQWTLDISGVVKKEEDNSRLEGAIINIYRNGAKVQSVNTERSGKFVIPLEPDGNYKIEVTKPGHVKKFIEVSTKGVPPEDAKYGFEFPVQFTLFEEIPDLDISILKKPLAKIRFNPNTGYFDYDEEYLKEVKKELERLKREWEEKRKAEEAARARREKEYNEAISAADAAFRDGEYDQAEVQYKKAAELKPAESYPKEKLKEIADIQGRLAEADKAYIDKISQADNAFNSKDYEQAKKLYTEASGLKPKEVYPREKLDEIAQLEADKEKEEQKYKELIAAADGAFGDENWENAKANYEAALGIKPDEQYPKTQIEAVNKKLEELAAADAEAKKKEEAYQAAITKGDAAFNEQKWEEAISAYTEAKDLKPAETYPVQRLKEIEDAVANAKELQAKYDQEIKIADDYFKQEQWDDAKASYEKAGAIKPAEEYPKKQIDACDAKIKEAEEALADKQRREEEYNQVIQEADDAFNAKEYEDSKTAYEKASGLLPDKDYPKQRLKELEDLMAELAAKDAEYKKFIDAGDAALSSEKYEDAKAQYEQALNVRPDEQYPQDKLKEIEDKLAELAAAEEAKQKLETEYNDLMTRAQSEMDAESYEKAKSLFEEASGLKPDEELPKSKISELEALLDKRDQQLKYNEFIAAADDHLTNEELVEAKSNYEKALTTVPGDDYATKKLAEVEALIEKKRKEEEIAVAMEKKEEQYKALIDEADGLYTDEDYKTSKAKYEEALALLPDEEYPTERIARIDEILKQLADEEAKNKAEEEARKKLEEEYNGLVAKGDAAFTSKEYADAKTYFEQAKELIPEETYPPQKIDEINDLMNEMEAQEAEYKRLIANGDRDFGVESYESARKYFEDALNIKPTEEYPKSKLDEINAKLQEMANTEEKERLAAEALRKKKEYYAALIAQGDGEFESEEYAKAKETFTQASGVLPDEVYPKERIDEIDRILDEIARKERENEQISIAMKQKMQTYNGLIELADKSFETKSYESARSKYEEALGIMPDEEYPKTKIAEIEQILADLALKEQQGREDQEKQAEMDRKYRAALSKADAAYNNKEYDGALAAYNEAISYKPGESYPKEQINKINDLLGSMEADEEARRKLEEKNKLYQDAIAKADESFNNKSWNSARVYYKEALSIKPSEQYPTNQLTRIDQLEAQEMADLDKKPKQEDNEEIAVNYGPRKTIDDEQEKELERMMADMRARREQEKYDKLEEYMQEQYDARNKLLTDANNRREDNIQKVQNQYEDFQTMDHDKRKEQEKLIRAMEDFSKTVQEQQQKHMDEANDRRESNREALAKMHEDWDEMRKDREKWMIENDEIVVKMQESVQKQQDDLQQQHATQVNRNVRDMEEMQQDWSEYRAERAEWMKENDHIVNDMIKANQKMMEEGQKREQSNHNKALEEMEEQERNWQDFLAETRERSKDRDQVLYQTMADFQEQQLFYTDQADKRREDNEQLLQDIAEEFGKMREDRMQRMIANDKAFMQFAKEVQERRQEQYEGHGSKTEKSAEEIAIQMAEIQKSKEQKSTMYEKGLREVNRQEKDRQDRLQTWKEENDQRRVEEYNRVVLDYARRMAELAASREEGYVMKQKELEARVMDIQDENSQWRAQSKERMLKKANVTYYRGEAQPHNATVAKKNSQGVTEKKYQEGDNIILERVVVNGDSADVYKKIHTTWGGVFYTKNGRNISEALWRTETMPGK